MDLKLLQRFSQCRILLADPGPLPHILTAADLCLFIPQTLNFHYFGFARFACDSF